MGLEPESLLRVERHELGEHRSCGVRVHLGPIDGVDPHQRVELLLLLALARLAHGTGDRITFAQSRTTHHRHGDIHIALSRQVSGRADECVVVEDVDDAGHRDEDVVLMDLWVVLTLPAASAATSVPIPASAVPAAPTTTAVVVLVPVLLLPLLLILLILLVLLTASATVPVPVVVPVPVPVVAAVTAAVVTLAVPVVTSATVAVVLPVTAPVVVSLAVAVVPRLVAVALGVALLVGLGLGLIRTGCGACPRLRWGSGLGPGSGDTVECRRRARVPGPRRRRVSRCGASGGARVCGRCRGGLGRPDRLDQRTLPHATGASDPESRGDLLQLGEHLALQAGSTATTVTCRGGLGCAVRSRVSGLGICHSGPFPLRRCRRTRHENTPRTRIRGGVD